MNIYYLQEIDYSESTAYEELVGEHSEVKVSFLYFLLDIVEGIPAKKIAHFHGLFLSRIFNSILTRKLNLSEKDFDKFFFFKKIRGAYVANSEGGFSLRAIGDRVRTFEIDRNTLLVKAKEHSFKKGLSSKFIAHLRKEYILNRHPSVQRFVYNAQIIHRICTNSRYVESEIAFFLFPDFFGKKVNQLLLNSDEKEAASFSAILQLLSMKAKKNDNQKEKIKELIVNIGIDFFFNTANRVLELVAGFKPKFIVLCFWNESKQQPTRYYIRMFE